jgi:Flp pilus assembly CpaF family ATPase
MSSLLTAQSSVSSSTPTSPNFGEIRGGQAFDLLQLLNSGHSGTLSTAHANSASQGISRFRTCVLQGGVEMPFRAIKTNIADSLNLIIQIEHCPGMWFVSEVLDINGYDGDSDRYYYSEVYTSERHPSHASN